MGQAQAYYEDGTPVPEDKFSEAVSSGAAHFQEGARVNVVVGGKSGSVLAEELPALLANGNASLADPRAIAAKEVAARKKEELEAYGGIGSMAALYHEQLLEGGSFGAYGKLAEAIAPEYVKGWRKRQEASPTFAASTSVAGMVGGTMLGGELAAGLRGAGATGRAASGFERLLGARSGASLGERAIGLATAPARAVVGAGELAGGAAVRSLARAGVTSPEALLAARLVASGAGEGAAIGISSEVTRSTLENRDVNVEKLFAAAGKDALFGAGAGALLGGVGAAGRGVMRGMSEGHSFSGAMKKFAERRAFKSVTGNYQKLYNDLTNYGKNPEVIERIGRKLLDRGVTLTNTERAVMDITEQLNMAEARMKGVARHVDDFTNYGESWQELKAPVADIARDMARKNRVHGIPEYNKVAEYFDEVADGISADLKRGRKWTFDQAWEWRTAVGKTVPWNKRAGDPVGDFKKEFYHRVDDHLEDFLRRRDPKLADEFAAGKEDWHDFYKIKGGAEQLVNVHREKNRWISPSDYGTGGVLGMLSALTGAGGVGIIASSVAGSAANKIAREKGPGVIARIADRLAGTDRALSNTLDAIADPKLAAKLKPLDVGATVGLTGAASVIASRSGREPTDFERKAANVVAFVSDPKVAAKRTERITEQLTQDHPDLVPIAHQLANITAQFLASKLPQPLTRAGHSLTPLAETPRVPRAEAVKWLRFYRGATNPMAVLDDLARGKLDRDGIEAIKATSPKLWEEVRTGIITRIAQAEEPLPFKRRVLLSLAFDFAGDRSLTPDSLISIQSTFAPAEDEQQEPPSGAAISPQTADALATHSQRAGG